jgi:hypothetical protein
VTDTLDLANDQALSILLGAAETVHRKYPDCTTIDHLYQEAYVWLLRHPLTVIECLKEDVKGARMLNQIVVDYLRSVARADRAALRGYSPDDECFYTPAVIAELLPLTLDLENALRPTVTDDVRTSGGGDPSTGGDLLVMLLDVRSAWANTPLSNDESEYLNALYMERMDLHHIAGSYQVEVEDVERIVKRGLRKLVDFLGGTPGGCKKSCECKDGS